MTEPNSTQPDPFIITSEDAPAFWQNDALWTVLASGEKTMGIFG